MIDSNLAIGPMSTEIIESIFRYSHFNRKPLMIIASKNQIDYNRGYIKQLEKKEDIKESIINEILEVINHYNPKE